MEQNPEKLIKKAEKYIKPGFFKAVFSDTNERLEKALNLYKEAAEIYIFNKDYKKAAECYNEVISLQEGLKIEDEIFDSYDSLINCYEKTNDLEKINKINDKLINIYLKNNEFSKAGELTFKKAKNLETNKNKINECLELYQKSFDFYEMDKEKNKNAKNKIKNAKADLITLNNIKEDLTEAKYFYDEIGNEYLNDNLNNVNKYFAKDYFAKNVITYFAYDDYSSAKAFLNKYFQIDKDFKNSSLGKCLMNFVELFEKSFDNDNNDDKLTFDNVSYELQNNVKNNKIIDKNWLNEMLKKIKIKFNEIEKENDFDDDDLR